MKKIRFKINSQNLRTKESSLQKFVTKQPNKGVRIHRQNSENEGKEVNATQISTYHTNDQISSPRSIKMLQNNSFTFELKEEFKHINKVVKESLNKAAKVLNNENGIKRAFSSYKPSQPIQSLAIQEIPETTDEEEKTHQIPAQSQTHTKFQKKEFPSNNHQIKTRNLAKYNITNASPQYGIQLNTTSMSIYKDAETPTLCLSSRDNGPCVNESNSQLGRKQVEVGNPIQNFTLSTNKAVQRIMQVQKSNTMSLKKANATLPRYAIETLLALYKGWKIRKILRSGTMSYLKSEIAQMNKMIGSNNSGQYKQLFKEKLPWLMNEFQNRFTKILEDEKWYQEKLIKNAMVKKISYALLNDETVKNLLDSSSTNKPSTSKHLSAESHKVGPLQGNRNQMHSLQASLTMAQQFANVHIGFDDNLNGIITKLRTFFYSMKKGSLMKGAAATKRRVIDKLFDVNFSYRYSKKRSEACMIQS